MPSPDKLDDTNSVAVSVRVYSSCGLQEIFPTELGGNLRTQVAMAYKTF